MVLNVWCWGPTKQNKTQFTDPFITMRIILKTGFGDPNVSAQKWVEIH